MLSRTASTVRSWGALSASRRRSGGCYVVVDVEDSDDAAVGAELGNVELAALSETSLEQFTDRLSRFRFSLVDGNPISMNGGLNDEHRNPSLETLRPDNNARHGVEKVAWVAPHVHVALVEFLGQGNVRQPVRQETELRDRRTPPLAVGQRLVLSQPVAEAHAEEFGNVPNPSLVPGQARLEVFFSRCVRLEKAEERQTALRDGNDGQTAG